MPSKPELRPVAVLLGISVGIFLFLLDWQVNGFYLLFNLFIISAFSYELSSRVRWKQLSFPSEDEKVTLFYLGWLTWMEIVEFTDGRVPVYTETSPWGTSTWIETEDLVKSPRFKESLRRVTEVTIRR